jgi:hypothetical protein
VKEPAHSVNPAHPAHPKDAMDVQDVIGVKGHSIGNHLKKREIFTFGSMTLWIIHLQLI